MKKKFSTTSKDKKDWIAYTKNLGNIPNKDIGLEDENNSIETIKKLDLHGYSLRNANKMVKDFIIKSFDQKRKKLLIVTGKGLRSKIYDDPYRSEKMNILKNSVPDYIKNDEELNFIVKNIKEANLKHGGEGAFYIFLKERKDL